MDEANSCAVASRIENEDHHDDERDDYHDEQGDIYMFEFDSADNDDHDA